MMRKLSQAILVAVLHLLLSGGGFFTPVLVVDSFSMQMMAGKKRRGSLQRIVRETENSSGGTSSVPNQGKGQEITGVTLPAQNKLKGWEFGEKQRMVCANVKDQFYAIQGDCPRCGFDLWKGTLITEQDDPKNVISLPSVACPTCATTYSLSTGKHGPTYSKTSSFLTGLAQTATIDSADQDAKAFRILRDPQDGRVYCRER